MILVASIMACFPEALCISSLRNTMKSSALPSEFVCPISLEMMTDPVVASDGFTYERECITKWLSEHTTSPTTNAPLQTLGLFENRGLKILIRESQYGAACKV
jgi:hypothetical protein